MLSEPLSVTWLPRCTVCAAPALALTVVACVTRTGMVSTLLRLPDSPMATSPNSYCPGGAENFRVGPVNGPSTVTFAGLAHSYVAASREPEASSVTVWLASGRVGDTVATCGGASTPSTTASPLVSGP